jgi:hypothetical protein
MLTIQPTLQHTHTTVGTEAVIYKHGCTNDIRLKWHATADNIKVFRDEKELHNKLLQVNLVSRVGTQTSLKRFKTDDGKKGRKRVKRREVKMTNVHLKGTEIGKILDAAKED